MSAAAALGGLLAGEECAHDAFERELGRATRSAGAPAAQPASPPFDGSSTVAAASAAAAAAEPGRGVATGQMRTLRVTVPTGARGGHPMLVHTPEGTLVQVAVPNGLRPGDAFDVQVRRRHVRAPQECAALLRANALVGIHGRGLSRAVHVTRGGFASAASLLT